MASKLDRLLGSIHPAQVIQRRRTHTVYSPALLAHGQYASLRVFRRCEVNVAELRQRVAHSVVDGSLADLATLDVSYRDAKR